MRNGYTMDTLTSVDIREIFNIRGKVIRIYEGVIYRENFKTSLFRKKRKTVCCNKKSKDERNDLMQALVKLLMNSLYEVQIRKVINDFYKSKNQHWMETEYDDNVLN